MSKRALIYILRYLLAIGLFAVYYAVFENQSHDLIQTVFAVAIGVGIATLPVKSKDQNKKVIPQLSNQVPH